MEILDTIRSFYLNFTYWALTCKMVEIGIIWVMHDLKIKGLLIAFKNTLFASSFFILGILIDYDNYKIYLTLCTPMALEFIGSALYLFFNKNLTLREYIGLIIIRNKF